MGQFQAMKADPSTDDCGYKSHCESESFSEPNETGSTTAIKPRPIMSVADGMRRGLQPPRKY